MKIYITKNEPITIVVQDLEKFPFEVTWLDAYQVALNKMNADLQKKQREIIERPMQQKLQETAQKLPQKPKKLQKRRKK